LLLSLQTTITLAKLSFIVLVFWISHQACSQRIYGGQMDRRVLSGAAYSYGFGCTYFTDKASLAAMPSQIKLSIYRKSDDKLIRTFAAQKQAAIPDYTATNCNKELKTSYVSVDYTNEQILKPDEFTDPEGYYVVSESVGVRSVSDNTTSKGVVLYHWFSPSYLFDLLDKEKGKVTVQWKPDAYNYFCNKVSNTISIIVKFLPPTSVVGSTIDFPLLGSTCRQAAPLTDNNGVLPFKEIEWNTGFSKTSQLPGGGPGVPLNPPVILDYAQELQIIISATPIKTGIYTTGYVFAFFRDKVKLCEIYREYQLQIVDCPTSPKAAIKLSEAAKPTVLADEKLCEGESVQLNAGAGQADVSYEWFKSGVKITGATDSVLVVKEAGNYTVTLNKKGSCDPALSDNQTIVVLSKPNATISSSVANGLLCANGSIKLTASPNTTDWTYQWLRNDAPIGTNNAIFDAKQDGKYSVKVSDINKCTATTSTIFEIKAAPPTVVQIDSISSLCVDSSRPYKLMASPKGGIFSGLGVKGDSLYPNLVNIGRNEVTYSINKTADCLVGAATKNFAGAICGKANLHISDAFSPNGDGMNDSWKIIGLDEYPEAELTIFDRWGNVVFNQKGSNQKPFDGQNLPTGVYAYQILTKPNGLFFRGSVTLLR
jgi:gliding motility-associated-like protein